MKIPNSGFMEDKNKINKPDKIFSVPVTQAINFTTQSHIIIVNTRLCSKQKLLGALKL